ncbi:WAT1-related protein [Camellia lanceoleosa]|uniref:WAT1-related protein n=1 Tax=Camellia lanceoleosa TaxID=1840588 RepID=A0ACC0G1E7_9ERIC|nr:WAT1-related protein [Camellia lanceoleosa]
MGSTYVFISVVSYVLYIILSGKVVMKYPAPLALTAYVCLTGAVINTGVALASEVRHKVSWSIGWNIKLLSYFYVGLVVSGLATYVQNMLIKSKGPCDRSDSDYRWIVHFIMGQKRERRIGLVSEWWLLHQMLCLVCFVLASPVGSPVWAAAGLVVLCMGAQICSDLSCSELLLCSVLSLVA